jgi:hypothetical protein
MLHLICIVKNTEWQTAYSSSRSQFVTASYNCETKNSVPNKYLFEIANKIVEFGTQRNAKISKLESSRSNLSKNRGFFGVLGTTNEFRNHFQNTSFHIVPTVASPRMSHQEKLFNDQCNTRPMRSFGNLDGMLLGSSNSESKSHFTADLKHHPGKIIWFE